MNVKNGKFFENYFSDPYRSELLNLSDGTLRTEDGRTFFIHRFTLARYNKYFHALFCSMGQEKDVLIPGINGENMSNILCYVYTGNIHVTAENIFDLIVNADYFMLDDLLSKLTQLLKENLTLTNSLAIFQVSLDINQNDISKKSYRYIQTHFESIVLCKDNKFDEITLETLKYLLSDKNLYVSNESIVWLLIIKWVEADTSNRLCCVPDLLTYLAIADVDENLASHILEHSIVKENPFCQEILNGHCCIFDDNNLKILRWYFQSHPRSIVAVNEHRQPRKFYIIVHEDLKNGNGTHIYMTYDENIDLWRKILKFKFYAQTIIFLNGSIYMFKINHKRNLCYNIVENQLNELPDFQTERFGYEVVVSSGRIYIVGGTSHFHFVTYMEFYDFEIGEWHTTVPMIPGSEEYFFATAVAHNNSIYVMRWNSFGTRMAFDFYDCFSDTWNMLPSPSKSRSYFTMVVYRGMIYVIGGKHDDDELKDVESFDPVQNTWSTEVDLPYAYYLPIAIVLNDKLIVYDKGCESLYYSSDIECNPPVEWNTVQKCWVPIEQPSMKNLRFYAFLTVEENECINVISTENKNSAFHFEDSHFA